jgi:hypothetical protein
MVSTVPTEEEINGNFEMSGATIYNPFSAHPNPGFDPARPVSPSNPQIIRDAFPGNAIPQHMIDPAAALFLQKYVPRPNIEMGMMGCGMTMMGAPTVIGAGMDCNNYLDVRNAHHVTDQATIRYDQTLNDGDSLFVRYSFSSERGFTPQNLPLSRISWTAPATFAPDQQCARWTGRDWTTPSFQNVELPAGHGPAGRHDDCKYNVSGERY